MIVIKSSIEIAKSDKRYVMGQRFQTRNKNTCYCNCWYSDTGLSDLIILFKSAPSNRGCVI